MSALPSPVREETDLPRQAHTGPLTRKEGLADYGKNDVKCRPILFYFLFYFKKFLIEALAAGDGQIAAF
jgi:hypothetical protein